MKNSAIQTVSAPKVGDSLTIQYYHPYFKASVNGYPVISQIHEAVINGTLKRETEKAILIANAKGEAWIPKTKLQNNGANSFTISDKWCKFTALTKRFNEKTFLDLGIPVNSK